RCLLQDQTIAGERGLVAARQEAGGHGQTVGWERAADAGRAAALRVLRRASAAAFRRGRAQGPPLRAEVLPLALPRLSCAGGHKARPYRRRCASLLLTPD